MQARRVTRGGAVFLREPNAALERTSDPGTEPVTLADFKLFLGIDSSDSTWNDLLNALIETARDACERYTGRALIRQTWKLYLDHLPGASTEWWDGMRELPVTAIRGRPAPIHLVRYPVQSVTSVKLYDEDDTATTVSTDVYQVDLASEPPRISVRREQVWPAVTLRAMNGVEVEFVAGYGATASTVPSALREGIKLLAAYLFEHRGACDVDSAVSQSGASSMWRMYKLGRI